jgi:hypothetical protein
MDGLASKLLIFNVFANSSVRMLSKSVSMNFLRLWLSSDSMVGVTFLRASRDTTWSSSVTFLYRTWLTLMLYTPLLKRLFLISSASADMSIEE